jgi:hypothetical protein
VITGHGQIRITEPQPMTDAEFGADRLAMRAYITRVVMTLDNFLDRGYVPEIADALRRDGIEVSTKAERICCACAGSGVQK